VLLKVIRATCSVDTSVHSVLNYVTARHMTLTFNLSALTSVTRDIGLENLPNLNIIRPSFLEVEGSTRQTDRQFIGKARTEWNDVFAVC